MSLAALPYGIDARGLMKSAGHSRPAYIHHHRSDAARRYLYQGMGIQDDTTPHLDANMLRRVAEKNSVVAIAIDTILNQVAEHFRKPLGDTTLGARVVQKDRKKAKTRASAKMAEHIESVLFNGGIVTNHRVTGRPGVWDGHYKVRADGLHTAVRKLMYDSLVLDRAFIEIEGSVKIGGKARNPVMFWNPADAGLIRTVETSLYQPQTRTDLVYHHPNGGTEGMVEYIMLDPMANQFGVLREYAWDEGAIGFRNPRTEFGTFGYGKSELEKVIDAITGILYGMNANKEYFTSNHVPLGVLNLIGNYTPESLDELRGHFKSTIGTPGHYYEFPVIAGQPGAGAGAQWVPLMDRSRQDLIFKVYMELCTVLVCGIFLIQPEEIGFASFGGSASTLNSGDPESTFQQSQHKGLLPKVLWLCDFLDRNIVKTIDDDFELIIQGLDARYSQEALLQAQLETTLLQNGATINDIRALQDLPPKYHFVDRPLLREVERDVAKGEESEKLWFPDETARVEKVREMYEERGGTLGNYTDAPGNPLLLEIWKQDSGFGQEQQAGEDLRNTANNELAGAQADDAAEAQGVRDQMGQLQTGHDQRDADRTAQEDADQKAGNLSIPQAEDARTRFKPGGKPGGGGGFGGGGFGKSYAAVRDRRRVVEVGPRDG